MKKLMLAIGLLVVGLVTVFSISSGRSLRASDEPVTSESSQTSIETTVPSEPINDLPPEVIQETVPAAPVQEEAPVVEAPTEESTAPAETIFSDTQVSQEPSVSEESSSESVSQESTVEESTTQESSSTTETTTSSTESTSTTESSTETSDNIIEETRSEEPEISTPSSSQEPEVKPAPAPEQPQPTEPAPAPSSPVTEPAIANYPAQPSAAVASSTLPTIGTTNPLGDREVELDESLRVSQLAESDFNGYELPLLSSFSDTKQGILVYEGLRQLGEKEADYTVQTLLDNLFSQLFNQTTENVTYIIEEKNLQPGDILVVDDQSIGLYLGEDHYLTVEEKGEDEETTQEVVIALLSEREEEEAISGLRGTDLNKTAYAEEVEQAYPATFAIEATEQTQQFIDQISDDAQKLGLKYDVFASVMIAQAILESGSGTSGLSVAPNYNLFGVKGSYGGQSVSLPTQEDRGNGELYTISAAFRRYPSYGESLGDYVTLIREGISGNPAYYQEAWRSEAKNYLRAAGSLTGKYATDTSYHRKISSIIAVYHLTLYDEPLPETVTGTTSAILQGKESIPAEYQQKMKLPDYDGKNYNTSGSYPVGQCTWYAFNRVAQLGGHVDDYMGNGGEWGTKGRALGYEVIRDPKAGYLVSFSPGTAGSDPRYGHVAFVEAVTENGILISEGNVVGGTTISYRVISNDIAKSNLVSYIKPK
ncbi:glucosaminidase domain-containing protein [Enterococcus sp. 669A]|uniref:Glucosaminidase domain-containing protein n=1 Tax=Candidatus Enterococcus moelleringii TaxID=2815325 RepID=A0ABS3L9D7_9ENTE|nr:glucosaminidase domain-containing protein [Enterococcus sp. 669A]MBO1306234.1 glucosaminidase domain-containing protein [Enterococcus sp. 669A]